MSNNNEHLVSSISLYARSSDSFLFSPVDENSLQDQMSSELGTILHSRMDFDTNNTNNINNETNTTKNEWSVHSPEVRTIFEELRIKLKDIEAVYKKHDTTEHNVVHTSETIENVKKLGECVMFFKEKIDMYFNKFIDCQIQCEREEAFLSQCSSLLDVIQNPSVDELDFNECANNICTSLETFTSQIHNKISQNRKNREIYWSQYKEFRDSCKLVKEVQSDIICQICMEREVGMALNCGHCFCTKCSTRCSNCPNCRTEVTQKLKLFF